MAVFFKKRGRRSSLAMLLLGSMVVLSLLLAACGNSSTTTTPTGSNPTSNPATSTSTSPTDLITPGVLTVGSDTTYPPQEYIDSTTNQPVGFDVDLITAIAQRMGLKANIVTTKFATIIDDLAAKRFDVSSRQSALRLTGKSKPISCRISMLVNLYWCRKAILRISRAQTTCGSGRGSAGRHY